MPDPTRSDRFTAEQKEQVLEKGRKELADTPEQKKKIIQKIQDVVEAGKTGGGIDMLKIFDAVEKHIKTLPGVDAEKVKADANEIIRTAIEEKIGRTEGEIKAKLDDALNAMLAENPPPVAEDDRWKKGESGGMEPAYIAEIAKVEENRPQATIDDLYSLIKFDSGKRAAGKEQTRNIMLAYILRAAYRWEQAESRFQHVDVSSGKAQWLNQNKGYTGKALLDRVTRVTTGAMVDLDDDEKRLFEAEALKKAEILRKANEKVDKEVNAKWKELKPDATAAAEISAVLMPPAGAVAITPAGTAATPAAFTQEEKRAFEAAVRNPAAHFGIKINNKRNIEATAEKAKTVEDSLATKIEEAFDPKLGTPSRLSVAKANTEIFHTSMEVEIGSDNYAIFAIHNKFHEKQSLTEAVQAIKNWLEQKFTAAETNFNRDFEAHTKPKIDEKINETFETNKTALTAASPTKTADQAKNECLAALKTGIGPLTGKAKELFDKKGDTANKAYIKAEIERKIRDHVSGDAEKERNAATATWKMKVKVYTIYYDHATRNINEVTNDVYENLFNSGSLTPEEISGLEEKRGKRTPAKKKDWIKTQLEANKTEFEGNHASAVTSLKTFIAAPAIGYNPAEDLDTNITRIKAGMYTGLSPDEKDDFLYIEKFFTNLASKTLDDTKIKAWIKTVIDEIRRPDYATAKRKVDDAVARADKTEPDTEKVAKNLYTELFEEATAKLNPSEQNAILNSSEVQDKTGSDDKEKCIAWLKELVEKSRKGGDIIVDGTEILDTEGIKDIIGFINIVVTRGLKPPGKNGLIDCFDGLKDYLDEMANDEGLTGAERKKFFEEVNKLLRKFSDQKIGETSEQKNEKIRDIINKFKRNGWLTTDKPTFSELWTTAQAKGFDAVKNLIGEEDAQNLFLLGYRREVARKAEENKRWKKVIKIKDKFYWPDKKRGWESDDALIGEDLYKGRLKRGEELAELTGTEITEYESWLDRQKEQKVRVKEILDYIAGLSIAENADLAEEARKIFDTLMDPVPDDPTSPTSVADAKEREKNFIAFAEQGNCLDASGKPDKEACKRRLRVYGQYLHGKLGHFEEMEEKISAVERDKILDNQETAVSILEDLKDEMGKPDIYETAEKLYEIIKYNAQGEGMDGEDKKIYIQYIHLRDTKFPVALRKDNLTMLQFLQAILKQKQNPKTNNLKEGDNGWELAEEWNIEDSDANRIAFATDMHRYKEVMGFLKEQEKRKPETSQKTEKQLRTILEHLAKNYKKPESLNEEQKAYYKELEGEFPDILDKLRYVYKAIIAMKEVDINKMKFIESSTEPPPEQTDPIDETRNKYAELRRKLSLFRGSKKAYEEINQAGDGAREKYLKSWRKKVEQNVTVDPQVRGLSFLSINRDTSKQIIAQKIVEKVLEERKALLTKEIELQQTGKNSAWEKFKTMWRKHPIARLCMGVGIGAAGLVSSSLTVPAIIGMAGLRFVGGMVTVEGIWEGLRNRFTGMRKKGANADMEKLAAFTTLATSTKPGYAGMPPPAGPGGPRQMYEELMPIYAQPGVTQMTGYREKAYKDLGEKNQEMLIQTALTAMKTHGDKTKAIAAGLNAVMAKETEFLKAVEEREKWLMWDNFRKKLSAGGIGLLWGGSKLLDLAETPPPKPPVPEPKPPVPHSPGPGPGPIEPPPPGPGNVPGPTPGHRPVPPGPTPPPGPVPPIPHPPTPGPSPFPPTPDPNPSPFPPVPHPPGQDLPPVDPNLLDPGIGKDYGFLKIPASIPGDVDPGVIQSFQHNLDLSKTEWKDFLKSVGGLGKLKESMMTLPANQDVAGRVWNLSDGQLLKNWNAVGNHELLALRPNMTEKLYNVVKGRMTFDEMLRKLKLQ